MSQVLMDIQTAIYVLLSGDAALMGQITGVFDDPDDDQAFPYVVIGEATESAFNTFTRDGSDCTIVVHIWTRKEQNAAGTKAGFKEALTIHKRVKELLDDASLSLANSTAVLCQFEDAETIRDPDGKTRQVASTYRVIAQEV